MPYRLPLLALALAVVPSCKVPPDYRINSGRPHRDVLVLTVFMSQATDPERYEEIAVNELRGFLATHLTEHARETPLYEVRFEFLLTTEGGQSYQKVATVQFLHPSVPTVDNPPSPRVIVYPLIL